MLLATGAQYRRLPVDRLAEFEGTDGLLRRRGARGPALRRLARRGRRRRQLRRPGSGLARPWRRARHSPPPPRRPRARRCPTTSSTSSSGTASPVRDRSEIAALHGEDGRLAGRHAHERRAPSLLVHVPVPRRASVHRVARRHRRPRRTTASSSPARRRTWTTCSRPTFPACSPPATSAPGSTKRCATAVGEGAMAVQFVHAHLARTLPFEERDVSERRLHPPRSRSASASCRRRSTAARIACGRAASGSHLRICLTCGHVGCCDDSPNRHATAHAHATSHPIIRSLEPGEDWNWCYVDEVAFVVDGIRGTTRIPPSCRSCSTRDCPRRDCP